MSTTNCQADCILLTVTHLSRSFRDGKSWNEDASVEFLLLMSGDDKWPAHKRMDFWEHAGRVHEI